MVLIICITVCVYLHKLQMHSVYTCILSYTRLIPFTSVYIFLYCDILAIVQIYMYSEFSFICHNSSLKEFGRLTGYSLVFIHYYWLILGNCGGLTGIHSVNSLWLPQAAPILRCSCVFEFYVYCMYCACTGHDIITCKLRDTFSLHA